MTLALLVVPGVVVVVAAAAVVVVVVLLFFVVVDVVVDGDDVLDLVAKQSMAECGIVNIVIRNGVTVITCL